MPSVNPNLRLSREEGHEDYNRGQQVLGVLPFDWRDWLNHEEFMEMAEPAAVALAYSRFAAMRLEEDLDSALIAFKMSVMQARVSNALPYTGD